MAQRSTDADNGISAIKGDKDLLIMLSKRSVIDVRKDRYGNDTAY